MFTEGGDCVVQAAERSDQVGAVPIIRNDGEGETRWFYGGGVHTWKASAEETDGAFLLFEDCMTQGKATPLHVHAKEDEGYYVVDGEIVVHIDGTDHRVGPRGLAVVPRGVPHAFLVTSATARVLTLQTPGSAEAFYRGASEPASIDTDPAGPIDFARVQEAAKHSGAMQVLGPPPFAAARIDAEDPAAVPGA
jgi:mannose-6-phosphate isomerase-like protein (cupin superfamily)